MLQLHFLLSIQCNRSTSVIDTTVKNTFHYTSYSVVQFSIADTEV